jgi:hypothetical protein
MDWLEEELLVAAMVGLLTLVAVYVYYHHPPTKYVAKAPFAIDFDAKAMNLKLVSFRGIPQNPSFRVDELEELATTFESRDGDVFICTYPKCGTTWMQQICHLLVHGASSSRDVQIGGRTNPAAARSAPSDARRR